MPKQSFASHPCNLTLPSSGKTVFTTGCNQRLARVMPPNQAVERSLSHRGDLDDPPRQTALAATVKAGLILGARSKRGLSVKDIPIKYKIRAEGWEKSCRFCAKEGTGGIERAGPPGRGVQVSMMRLYEMNVAMAVK